MVRELIAWIVPGSPTAPDYLPQTVADLCVVAKCPTKKERARRRKGWRPAMNFIGIDVHKKQSQICVLNE
jgi:hypothetical protein